MRNVGDDCGFVGKQLTVNRLRDFSERYRPTVFYLILSAHELELNSTEVIEEKSSVEKCATRNWERGRLVRTAGVARSAPAGFFLLTTSSRFSAQCGRDVRPPSIK